MRSAVRDSIGLAAAAALVAGCGPAEPARVTIPAGATMRAAAESLYAGDVIRFPSLFSAYAKARGQDRFIKAGTYVLSRNATWNGVLTVLRGGGAVLTVLIPEGLTLAQIEALLVAKLGVPPDSAAAATRDTALLRHLGVPIATLEGYLFPDTYFFPPGTPARVAVVTMVRRFEQQWKPEWTRRLDTLGMSRHAAVTLSSIVEREAKLPEERPIIAAVYLSRLRRGMRLQADPTVQYVLPQYQTRLLNRHLAVESPYNTYRHKGLPPGPIGAPGAASLRAALYPANVPYLYFVAFPDGHHEFRVTVEQHQAAVRQSRRAWDAVRARQQREARASTRGRPGG